MLQPSKKWKNPKRILDSILPDNFVAITLAPFGIYYRKLNDEIIVHEEIHWQQQVELLFVFFYVVYLVNWLICLACGKSYEHIIFEKEAYGNDSSIAYLKERKRFNWIKYIKK